MLSSTTYYYYNDHGNVTRVVTEPAEPESGLRHYTATWLKYATNGQAVTFVVGEEWDAYAGSPGCPENYTITYAREFWYDGARQRYLNRELDPVALTNDQMVTLSETWSDYDGDAIYGDFALDGSDVTVLRSFERGLGRVENPLDLPNRDPYYYHTDHLGTTRGLTRSSSAWVDESTYTAFGELLDGTDHRYGYVGKAGYQAHAEFPYLHVGWRYYDPRTGRFLQRDPIGIDGELNVYAYASNNPVATVDPMGLYSWDDFEEDIKDIGGVIIGIASAGALIGGGELTPGTALACSGGVLVGVGSATSFYRRHPGIKEAIDFHQQYHGYKPRNPPVNQDPWYCTVCNKWEDARVIHLHAE